MRSLLRRSTWWGLSAAVTCSCGTQEPAQLDPYTAEIITKAELVQVFYVNSKKIAPRDTDDRGRASFYTRSGPHKVRGGSLASDVVAETWRRELASDADCECGSVVVFRSSTGQVEMLVSGGCRRLFVVRGGFIVAVADVGDRISSFAASTWHPSLGYLD